MQAQAAREQELRERELALRNTEMELKLRQKILLDERQRQPPGHIRKPSWPQTFDSQVDGSDHHPVTRKISLFSKTRGTRKLSKKDISTPTGFRHVTHMGSGADPVHSTDTETIGALTAVPVHEAAAAAVSAQRGASELPPPPPPVLNLPKVFRVTSQDFTILPPRPPHAHHDAASHAIPPPKMFATPPPHFGE